MKKLFLFLLFLAGMHFCKAQDTIVKKNGDLLKVKVTEVGIDEIKYKAFGAADSPVIAIKRDEVKKVVVSGQVVFDEKSSIPQSEDILIKKDGTLLKVHVLDIGTNEVKFKLYSDPDGPSISIAKSEIKTLKIGDQVVIENKKEVEDLIVKKDGTSIKAKVLEMGNDYVKYKLYDAPDGPVLSLKKKEIKTVKVNGQVVYEYKEDPYSISNNAILNKTNVLKFQFFSPLFNYVQFSYEWMEKPGFNWEAGAGLIGIGVGNTSSNGLYGITRREPKGFFVRGGPKFLVGSGSDIEVEGERISHPLKGRYVQIEAILHTVSRGYSMDTFSRSNGSIGTMNWTKRYQSLVLNIIYGRQNIYSNAITLGYYIGFGYAIEDVTLIGTGPSGRILYDYFDVQRFSHVYFGPNFPLTFTWGFTVGYIHKGREKTGNKSYKNNPHADYR